jgi:FKBP-type peptidyl-prolyl cis-trans isomerase FkpA
VRRINVLTFLFVNAAIPLLMAQTTPTAKPAAPKTAASSAAKTSTAVKKPAAPAPMTDEQKTIYALGLIIYERGGLGSFGLSPAELDLVKKGISDAAADKPAVDLQTYGPKIGPLQQARSSRAAEKEKTASTVYLAKAAAAPGAVKTTSGMIYKELTPGSGDSPKPTDTVKVHYRGTRLDGTEFDSSYKLNEPAEFPLDHVIPCWTEGLQKMKVGGKAQLVCPSSIAYGDAGKPPTIPPGATLVFEVELLGITAAK